MTMNKTRWLALAGSAAALALLAWALRPEPLAVEVAGVSRGDFEQTIAEDGRTRLRDRYTVAAPLAAQLARITWREGDAVQAGQVLARLTPLTPALLDERTQHEQQARLVAAQAHVQRAGSALERARAALAQAQADERRSQALAGQGFSAPAQLESARLALTLAQRDAESAQSARQAAEAEAQAARAALARVREGAAGGGELLLRAPVAGRVLKVHQPSQTTVAPGSALVELGDTTRLEVVAELLTTDAVRVPPGAPVRIERWGGPGELAGRVRRVEPSAFTKVSALGVEEQRVRVLIEPEGPPVPWAALGDGFRVGVRIVTLARAGVLTVPTSAVFPLPQPAGQAALQAQAQTQQTQQGQQGQQAEPAAVFVLEAGRARLRPVGLGGRNGHQAWISTGLAAGQQVVVYPPAELADGTAVRVREVPVR